MIVTAIIVLGSLGILFGLGLSLASKKFHVEIDPKIEQIESVLPNANCGGCGYAGCAAYAEAIVMKGVDIGSCSPGGEAVMKKIAAIMGIKPSTKEPRIAMIHCQSGGINNTHLRYHYDGVHSCLAASRINDGHNACQYGCLGYNDCMNACPFDAIFVDENNMRHINESACVGCGKCVEACPRNLIELVPMSKKVHVRCASQEKGTDARTHCGNATACIGCGLCAKKCPVDAIHIENNLAHINYEICISCGQCAKVCPTHAIIDLIDNRPQPYIREEECIGCGLCAKNCPAQAIDGSIKQPHHINEEKCIQCGICVQKCPKHAIILHSAK